MIEQGHSLLGNADSLIPMKQCNLCFSLFAGNTCKKHMIATLQSQEANTLCDGRGQRQKRDSASEPFMDVLNGILSMAGEELSEKGGFGAADSPRASYRSGTRARNGLQEQHH